MKLYMVSGGYYDYFEIGGYFLDKKKADIFVKLKNEKESKDFKITEIETIDDSFKPDKYLVGFEKIPIYHIEYFKYDDNTIEFFFSKEVVFKRDEDNIKCGYTYYHEYVDNKYYALNFNRKTEDYNTEEEAKELIFKEAKDLMDKIIHMREVKKFSFDIIMHLLLNRSKPVEYCDTLNN